MMQHNSESDAPSCGIEGHPTWTHRCDIYEENKRRYPDEDADYGAPHEGTHCRHWWEQNEDESTECCYCGDDSSEGEDSFSERCPSADARHVSVNDGTLDDLIYKDAPDA